MSSKMSSGKEPPKKKAKSEHVSSPTSPTIELNLKERLVQDRKEVCGNELLFRVLSSSFKFVFCVCCRLRLQSWNLSSIKNVFGYCLRHPKFLKIVKVLHIGCSEMNEFKVKILLYYIQLYVVLF